MITTIVVADCETSDLPENPGAALLEVAWVVLESLGRGHWAISTHDTTLVEHTGPISPSARAAHHISPADVAPGAPEVCPREAVIHSLLAAEEPGNMCWAFHNAIFDKQFLPELTLPVLCTYRLARHLFPEAPSHGNQSLRYYLDLMPERQLLEGSHAHRALYDSAVTAALLARMLREHSPEELLELQDKPILQTTCRFGKNRGMKWADVQPDYMRWLLNKSDMVANDLDLKHTVRYHLGLIS